MIFWPAAICSRCNLHFSDLWEQEWMTRINCTKLEPMWGTKKKIVLYIKQIICNFVFCVVESLYTLPVEEMSSLALPKTPLVFLRLPIHLYLNHLAPILHSPVSPPISFSVLVGVTSFFFFFSWGKVFESSGTSSSWRNTALIIQQVAEIQPTSSGIDLIHKSRKDSSFLSFILSAFQENVG